MPPRAPFIEIRGERLDLLPHRALWWPARSTLIVADVHLGKSEAYRALGVPIPGGIAEESMGRLADAVAVTGATRVIVLGDLVHAKEGLTSAVRDHVGACLKALGASVLLVRGNHDPMSECLPREWAVECVESPQSEEPFVLAHAPEPVRGRYVLAGHLHPTLSLSDGFGSMRLPCFHFGPRIGVLPAFSRFTRGVPMSVEPGDRAFVIAEGEVIEIGGGETSSPAGDQDPGLTDA